MLDLDQFSAMLAGLISERRVAIFCGAGVSRASGLPIVSDLLDDLFEWLELSRDQRDAIAASTIPFERVMELVLGELPSREPFLDLFKLGNPSLFHHFVGALVKKGLIGTVVTTNFDQLLERAIRAHSGDQGLEVAVVPRQLMALDEPSQARVRLVKLHGCVSNYATIATELAAVGSALLTPARRKAVEWAFQTGPHSHVLVAGYSCSDAFDIAPILRSLNGGTKSVLFADHRSDGSVRHDIEPCACPPSVRSFATWEGFALDTSELCERLCGRLGLDLRSEPTPVHTLWRPAFADWLTQCDASAPASRDRVAGALLGGVGLPTAAMNRVTSALRIAADRNDVRTLAICHQHLAHLKIRHTAASDEGRRHIWAARELLGITPPRETEMRLLGLESDLDALAGRFAQSAQLLERALSLCSDDLERGHREHRLALVRRKTEDFVDSEARFHRAIEAFDATGDLVSKARAIGDLGNLYSNIGKLTDALQQFEEALALSRQLGDKHGESVRRANLGELMRRMGDAEGGLAQLMEAVEAARAAGDLNALSSRVGNLGMVFYQRRELERALEVFIEALALARQAENREREMRWITNIGITLGRLGRTAEAIERLETAERSLGEMLGSDHSRVRWVRDCLLFARSEVIRKIAGAGSDAALLMSSADGLIEMSWDVLAP